MKLGDGKRLIERLARDAMDGGLSSEAAFHAISESEAVEVFDALRRAGNQEFVGASRAVGTFLFETHRRFTVRGYPGAQEQGRALAPELLRAFELVAGEYSRPAAILRLQTLVWRIADELGYKPMYGWPAVKVDARREEIHALASLAELNADGQDVVAKGEALLDGCRDALRSSIEFELPHPLVRRESVLNLTYQDLRVVLTIRPRTSAPDLSELSEPTELFASTKTIGGGTWPPGSPAIELVAHGLVDWTAAVPAYRLDEPGGGQSMALPWLGAEVVRAALAEVALVAPDELDGLWMPSANDIRSFSFSVTAADGQVLHSLHAMPSGARVTMLDHQTVTIDLGHVGTPQPWKTARTYAHGALRVARYFDAVIWANVAVEAFIDQRLREFSSLPGVNVDLFWVGTNVFGEAEQIVANARPDLAGYFEWPDREAGPSRFRQISAAGKCFDLRGTLKQLKSAYSRVSGSRNDAIHGRTIDFVTPNQAGSALEALDEFTELFTLESPTN